MSPEVPLTYILFKFIPDGTATEEPGSKIKPLPAPVTTFVTEEVPTVPPVELLEDNEVIITPLISV